MYIDNKTQIDYDKTSLIGGNANPYGDVCYKIANEAAAHPDPRTFKGSSILQVLIGVLSLICGVLSLLFVNCQFSGVYVGVWSGILFIISGWMGLHLSYSTSRGWIITYIVMSSLSLLASCAAIGLEAYSLVLEENSDCLRLEKILLIAATNEMVVAILSIVLCSLRLKAIRRQYHGLVKRSPIYKPLSPH